MFEAWSERRRKTARRSVGRMARTWVVLSVVTLTACAPLRVVGPEYPTPEARVASQWQATLPHGASSTELSSWWSQFEDPVLVRMIEAAQRESASLAQAQVRVAQARAQLIAAGAASQPTVDLVAGVNRAAVSFGGPVIVRTLTQVGPQLAWEIDLFGGNLREREAANARLAARQADWHDARVLIAAETAQLYTQYRFCELQAILISEDLKSRVETARLTELAAKAGFQAPANLSLARASVADSQARLSGQVADCELIVKAMVALTALDESTLRTALTAGRDRVPQVRGFEVTAVPAQLLSQRPDLAAAERDLAAANADIGVAEAAHYPRLSLLGSIQPSHIRSSGQSLSLTPWSIGPSLSLPLLDGGRRAATVETARLAYRAAESAYRSRVRLAVREVEDALVRLDSANRRKGDVDAAATGYRANLTAAQTRYQAGVGSLLELEESRRLSLLADASVIAIDRDRIAAWIGLYRAVGGGWTDTPRTEPARTPVITKSAS